MRRWMRTTGLVAALGTIAAAMWMQACSSHHASKARVDQASPSRPVTQDWRPLGLQTDSLGLSASTVPEQYRLRSGRASDIAAELNGASGLTATYEFETSDGDGQFSPPAQIFRDTFNDPASRSSPIPGPLDFVLRPGEELWVIERRTTFAPPTSDDFPGCGSLMTQVRDDARPSQNPDEQAWRTVAVPLQHTDVQARIDGYIGTVRVQQQFINPFSEKIEAVYVFPLPENAAVNDFLMTVGDRTIRGVIREREEAEKIYAEARRQGHTASLLTQERPNIFTQHVANIEPGRRIDIDIRYFHTMAYRDGWFEWVFPLVVGPRFNPPGTASGIGAVARGQHGASGQPTEVQYLRPTERSGHEVSLSVDLDAGVPIESVECRTHQVAVRADPHSPHRAQVSLSSLSTIPNKDFVLRYRVAGRDVKSAMLTQVSDKGGFFSLMLVPPADLDYTRRGPIEMVYVIDRSGSMEGEPLAQAARAVEQGLRQLEPGDTFQIIDFSESSSTLGAHPLPATWENIRRGLDYARNLRAGGGTHMVQGLRAALGFRHDSRRLRFVCFLTDGFIGNEADILAETRRHLGEARIFSMGIGSSVNRYLLEDMAKVGMGVAAFIAPGDDAADVMDRFTHRIAHAAMTDLRIDWGGMEVSDVYPKRIPDLFVGRPVIVTGRYRGAGSTTVKVTGRIAGERMPLLVPVDMDGRDGPRGSLPAVWARAKLAELGTRLATGQDTSVIPDIRRTALEHGLMSAYTAFIAVDSLARTPGRPGTTVEVAVPVPEGVGFNSTVPERRSPGRRAGDDRP